MRRARRSRRPIAHTSRRSHRGRSSSGGLHLERLEARQLLSVSPISSDGQYFTMTRGITYTPVTGVLPVTEAPASTATTAANLNQQSFPLSAIPALSSDPSAPASIYLDFDGHFEPVWFTHQNVTTPPFDIDGDPTTFSAEELIRIQQIWAIVAEDFAPYNVNVTTVEPASFANGEGLRVAIGGSSSDWYGNPAFGVALVNSFSNASPNTAYTFSESVVQSNWTGEALSKVVGEVTSHEAGHAFGLRHQSTWDAQGNKTQEYSDNGADAFRAPIMGNSYRAERGLWWVGTNAESAQTIQDDMAGIAEPKNVFGLRVDDHGNTPATATPLQVTGGTAVARGIIEQIEDVDYFSFRSPGGTVTIDVIGATDPMFPDMVIQNLDVKFELRSSTGTLIETVDPANSLNASLSRSLVAGDYMVGVMSHGQMGDVGVYQITVGGIDQIPGPALSINDVTQFEGDAGLTPFEFTVTLSEPVTQQVTVQLTLEDGTATFGEDYIGFETVPTSEFNIEVVFPDNTLTPSQQAVFTSAAARWEQLIIGDLPDVLDPILGLIDDVRIEATAPFIDGPGGILGQAGPRLLRTDGTFLPYDGVMEFDSADLADLEADGEFEAVILHEMGHVLGFGSIWQILGLLQGAGGDDPRFVGTGAVAEYNAIFGVTGTVPVENEGGPGTRDGHWRETVFGHELMTGFLDSGVFNPISRVTTASLADMGYEVNLDASDPYTPPSGAAASGFGSLGRILALQNAKVGPGIVLGSSTVAATQPASAAQQTTMSLVFAPGETSKTVTVLVVGDTNPEPDETFFVNLSNPTGALIQRAQGIGTILNDDRKPIQPVPDFARTPVNTSIVIDVLANDLGPDDDDDPTNDPPVNRAEVASIIILQRPVAGTVVVDPLTHNVRYTPNPGFIGPDGFNYTVLDIFGGQDPVGARVEILVQAPPIANDDGGATDVPGTPIEVDVRANDRDDDGNIADAVVELFTLPSHGTVVVDPLTQHVIYTPEAGFIGGDELTYRLVDVDGWTSNLARVRFRVGPAVQLSGRVYTDINDNNQLDGNEIGIAGVTVIVAKTNGALQFEFAYVTGADGTFVSVEDVPNGRVLPQGVYSLHEIQPAIYLDGQDRAGTPGAAVALNDRFEGIVLSAGQSANGYMFGERGLSAGFIANVLGGRLFTTTPVTNVTSVTGSTFAGLNLSQGERWYVFDAGWDGLRTITATHNPALGPVSMTLHDANYKMVASATRVGNVAQLTYRGTPGQPLFLRIWGTNPSVTLDTGTPNSPHNWGPVLAAIAPQTVAAGQTLSLQLSAQDGNGDRIRFALAAGSPAGARIDPVTGLFTWTPAAASPSPVPIKVVVYDHRTPAGFGTRVFQVTVTNGNGNGGGPLGGALLAGGAPAGGGAAAGSAAAGSAAGGGAAGGAVDALLGGDENWYLYGLWQQVTSDNEGSAGS